MPSPAPGGTGGVYYTSGAGPYIAQPPNKALPMSAPELLLVMLGPSLDPDLCPHVIVGPAENQMQQEGVASITAAGRSMITDEQPVKYARLQVRCMAHTMAHAEQIGEHVNDLLHIRHRQVVEQPSSGNSYLVHRTKVLAGPSNHFDSVATWESLMFVELMVGTQPVS